MRQKLTISQIKDLEAQLSSRYTKAEVDAIISGVEANFNGDLSQLNTLVVAEVSALKTRMLDAEGRLDSLDNSVESLVSADSAESAARVAGDATNAAAISAEETRATAAEQAIAADLATETAARIAGDTANSNALSIEVARAQAAEQSLAGDISTLEGQFSTAVTALETKDAEHDAAIAAETAARVAADSGLDTRVSALEATDGAYDTRMDAIEQSVTDEATARANADTYLQGQVTSIQNSLPTINSDINAERQYRIDGDANLQSQIDALEASSGGSVSALEGRVTAVEAKNVEQDGRLDTVEAGLAAEITRATGVEGSLANLNLQDNDGNPLAPANLVDAINMVNSTGSVAMANIEDALAQEVADRTAADSALAADIAAVETDLSANYMKKSGIVQQSFVATAGQTVFTLTEPVAAVFIAMVMINGVQYLMGSDFTLSGTTLTFSSGLVAGDEVQATYFNK